MQGASLLLHPLPTLWFTVSPINFLQECELLPSFLNEALLTCGTAFRPQILSFFAAQ